MEQFITITGLAAPLMRANIDTDVLIPSKEMTGTGKEGYGEKLFAPWRYLTASQAERQQDVLIDDPAVDGDTTRVENPEFVLNRAPFRQAIILIAGANFGCGSSREQAVWAVRQFGFRCVIAPSFGTIFRNNCYRNGVLPVEVPAATVQALAADAEGGQLLTIDLAECAILRPDGGRIDFVVAPAERTMLLEGLDAIGLTLKHRDQIEAFQRAALGLDCCPDRLIPNRPALPIRRSARRGLHGYLGSMRGRYACPFPTLLKLGEVIEKLFACSCGARRLPLSSGGTVVRHAVRHRGHRCSRRQERGRWHDQVAHQQRLFEQPNRLPW